MPNSFTAWKGNGATTVTYPSTNTNDGFAAGSTLNADEFNGAFRMMSVVAAAIMQDIPDVDPGSAVDSIWNAINTKIAGITVDNATHATTADSATTATNSNSAQSATNAEKSDSLTIRNANEIFFNTIETTPKDVLVGYRWNNKVLNTNGEPNDPADLSAISSYRFWNSRGIEKSESNPNGSGSLANVEAKNFIGNAVQRDNTGFSGTRPGGFTLFPEFTNTTVTLNGTTVTNDFPTGLTEIYFADLLAAIHKYAKEQTSPSIANNGIYIVPAHPSSKGTCILYLDEEGAGTTAKITAQSTYIHEVESETVTETVTKSYNAGDLPKYAYGYFLWRSGIISYFGTEVNQYFYHQITEAPGYAKEALFPNGFDGKKSNTNSSWWKVSDLQNGTYITDWQKSSDDPDDPADIAFVQTGNKNQNVNIALDGWYYGNHAYYKKGDAVTDTAYIVPAATGAVTSVPDGYRTNHAVVAAEEAITSNKIKIGGTDYTLSLNGTTLTFTKG